jgi:L-threonylcarbamoyladenylate synthase
VTANDVYHVSAAVRALRAGGVVAHATEAVWGLACDPFDAAAVARLLDLKGRAISKGLIVIAAEDYEFDPELRELSKAQSTRVRRSWPGPETWLVPNLRFPAWITGDRATVAVRVPGHAQARRLCAEFGGPLVSTSANPSARPPARTELATRRYFQGRVDMILHGMVRGKGAPSRIRDAASGTQVR